MGILVYLRMDVLNAFLVATAFCYFAAFIMTCIGKPPLARIGKKEQSLMYIVLSVLILVVSLGYSPVWINFMLGLFYSFACVASFIGWPQIWNAYWTNNPSGSSATGQVLMAFWDLALAMIFFSLC
jgi:hypothetical protein